MVILDIKKPKKCIWYEDGQDKKCPLLDDNDCCRGQGNEANSAANNWDDLMKGCPIKWELVRCYECVHKSNKVKPVKGLAYCDYQQRIMYNTDFCNHGERKEKEDGTN